MAGDGLAHGFGDAGAIVVRSEPERAGVLSVQERALGGPASANRVQRAAALYAHDEHTRRISESAPFGSALHRVSKRPRLTAGVQSVKDA